jgi:hypothetical protein
MQKTLAQAIIQKFTVTVLVMMILAGGLFTYGWIDTYIRNEIQNRQPECACD